MALKFNPFTGTFDFVNDPATTSSLGLVQLAGDLGGTAVSPLVLKLGGVVLSGTPSAGQVLIATGSAAASWQAPTITTQRTFITAMGF